MPQPSDIEIYIRGQDTEAIREWLDAVFARVSLHKASAHLIKGKALAENQTEACELLLLTNAVKGYTSLWFKQNRTPWDTDLHCARSAFRHMQVEIRVSAGAWSEGAEDDLYYRINREGESAFLWQTH